MEAHVGELNDNLVARLSDILLHKDFPLTTPEERSKAVAFLCKLIGFDDVELAAGVVEDYMIDKDDAADVRQVRTMRRPFKKDKSSKADALSGKSHKSAKKGAGKRK